MRSELLGALPSRPDAEFSYCCHAPGENAFAAAAAAWSLFDDYARRGDADYAIAPMLLAVPET